ncbi:MAG: prephenate dehydratase [Geminicoccaceae bacterium]|nr:prephenate dehydratase [Geminicoccaceae bacterium]
MSVRLLDAVAAIPGRIAFQGALGAFSHAACQACFPGREVLPCASFEAAFAAVREGDAGLAVIPIDNSQAGRVADVHHLLPHSGLNIVGEHFLRVRLNLLGLRGAKLADIEAVHTHIHALGQCRDFLRRHGLTPKVAGDTAGAAEEVAAWGDPAQGAIASTLAAEIHGLDVLVRDVEDARHNTTRFLIFTHAALRPPQGDGETIASFLFQVRNVPAALYKALGGFATNGVNMIKLESYIDPGFQQARFYADILGHPDDAGVRRALDELRFFSHDVQLFGVYPASPLRRTLGVD